MTNDINGKGPEFIRLDKVKKPSKSPKPFEPLILILSFLIGFAIVRMLFGFYVDANTVYITPQEQFQIIKDECNYQLGWPTITSNITMVCDIGCNRHYYEIKNYNTSNINDTYRLSYQLIKTC